MAKLRTAVLMVCYCVALWLLCDFVYSHLSRAEVPHFRIADPLYNHGFTPNFSGQAQWGLLRYPMYTNNLGFRDGLVRDVPNEPTAHRVLAIGDSFTEAVGVTFEESFVGLLQHAGQSQNEKTEYLNAGVVSYSPTLYYAKIKAMLDRGLKFDEVMVFSDISDVQDEATSYFCVDDDPDYHVYCKSGKSSSSNAYRTVATWDPHESFVVSDQVWTTLKFHLYWHTGIIMRRLRNSRRAGWTLPGFDVGNDYAPLGVEGGIERSLKHMQALADLLSAHHIALTVVVYPWPFQLFRDDRNSRQVTIWRDFCRKNCKDFINLFPAFFAYKDSHPEWYLGLFILGDDHFSFAGNQLIFDEVTKRRFGGQQ